MKASGEAIIQSIENKEVLQNPSLLNRFDVISFADLKKFKFYYWVAFPTLSSHWSIKSKQPIPSISNEILQWISSSGATKKGYFIVKDNEALPLTDIDTTEDEITVGFVDSCVIEDRPSKFAQNFLTALSIYGFKKVHLNVYRLSGTSYTLDLENTDTEVGKVTGWERTAQGKLGPKLADLGSLIDPVQLSEQSVDLNLKLMKWRVAPEIDLDIIKDTKVLLLGAGTLGSYVARALLGWGVRNVTFVDNGKISFSNPVRQPLFNFEDVGEKKALKAAESLKKIFPLVNANGYELEIPMAGHPVTNDEKQKQDFEMLDKLIELHDVVFLLTDSREARWLPTLIGNVKKKIVINAALGFDSYLVMRHGVEGNLGCYFCNDVVAPTDSLTDRTLDQMCTVTRPGIALLASSLAVELLVSILQHPEKHYANANTDTILGKLPHQLRGFLGNFDTKKLETPAYEYCSACSKPIQEGYEEGGWDFVARALNEPQYLENVSGLTEVQRQAEEAVADLEEDFSDEEWK